MKRYGSLIRKAFLSGAAALALGALALGCPTDQNSNTGIGYTIAVDNVKQSLTFTFDSPISLQKEDIRLAAHSGRVSKDELTGGDAEYTLKVSVLQFGTVKVRIAKDGVDSGEKLIAIPEPVIGYSVKAAPDEYLTFTFDKLVNLQLADITIQPQSGQAETAGLPPEPISDFDLPEPPYYEQTWKLRIKIENSGTILAGINKAGIDSNLKPVQVAKPSDSGSWDYGVISEKPGLYENKKDEPTKEIDLNDFTLEKAFTYIQQHPADYTIVLDKDESPSSISPPLKDDSTITLIAVKDKQVTITLPRTGVAVNNGTFILGPGITLKGNADYQVSVEIGGTFKIQPGSAITDTTVLVTGKFLMSGGTISGNKVSVDKSAVFTMTDGLITTTEDKAVEVNGSFIMSGGSISNNAGDGVSVNKTKGVFTMTGGTISGNTGKGVDVSGKFTMTGGFISGNTDSGVSVTSGVFTMTGGEISGNAGKGVDVSGGTFTMNGGAVSENKDSSKNGVKEVSGVSVSGGEFTMNDGYVSDNTGSGVSVSGGKFTMTGGSISGNKASDKGGGGVVVKSDATFTMTGGFISGNTSSDNGGGVVVESTATAAPNFGFIMSGGYILKNTAGGSGGGVYVSDAGAFLMMGGWIDGNTAVYKAPAGGGGGGVYAAGRFVKTEPGNNGKTGVIYGYPLSEKDPSITLPDGKTEVKPTDGTVIFEGKRFMLEGNRVISGGYELSQDRGHAVYAASPAKVSDETVTEDW